MTRKMISLVGVFVAVFSLVACCTDAEARCGRQRNRCCQNGNFGYQQTAYYGQGCNSGCGWRGNTGCQQMGCQQQVVNTGCQPVSYQQTACCTSQQQQPPVETPAPVDNPAPAPIPTEAAAPAPAGA